MKILVCTTETLGQRSNDFCSVPEGEVLYFGFECDGEDIDGSCGCRRALCGIDSHTATSVMKVVESDMTKDEIEAKIIAFYHNDWKMSLDDASECATENIADMLYVASAFPVGSIIEKRGDQFQTRGETLIKCELQ